MTTTSVKRLGDILSLGNTGYQGTSIWYTVTTKRNLGRAIAVDHGLRAPEAGATDAE